MERRQDRNNQAIRIPVSIVVQAEGAGENKESTLIFFSQNLSMTGIYLESETLLPDDQVKEGEVTNLLFYLPSGGGTAVGARARVVRREQIRSFKGEAVHAIALEFIEIDQNDREKLRLFISEYETELENAVLAEPPDKSQEEITDPTTVVQPLKDSVTATVLFEPLGVEDYRQLYKVVRDIWGNLAQKKDVNITPLQLQMLEHLEQLNANDKRLLHELTSDDHPDLRRRILANLFFLRVKLSLETQQLLSVFEKHEPSEFSRQYLGNYFTSVCYEADQCNEAAHLVGQRLVTEENWDDFKRLNSLRSELDKVLTKLRTTLEPFAIFVPESAEAPQQTRVIQPLKFEDCLRDIAEIIPDPEEEKDEFPNGASGEDIRRLWDIIFALKDDKLKTPMVRALATRRLVRHDYLKSRELGEEVVNCRNEVTELFRNDAKLVKEMVAELMPLTRAYPQERETITLCIRLLEGLSFQFGKLVRMIPRRLLSTEEVETVRFRATTFRQKRGATLKAITAFSRKYLLKVAAAASVIFALTYQTTVHIRQQDKPVPIKLIDNLEVQSAFLEPSGCITLTVRQQQWLDQSPQKQQAYLSTLSRLIQNEGGKRFKLLDDKDTLLGVGLNDASGAAFSTLLTTNLK